RPARGTCPPSPPSRSTRTRPGSHPPASWTSTPAADCSRPSPRPTNSCRADHRAKLATVRFQQLTMVDGFIAFDIDDAPISAGGTRLAPDVTEDEVALLARAMT